MNSPLYEISKKPRSFFTPSVQRSLVVLGIMLIAAITFMVPVFAQSNSNPSGFEIPRFVSIRAQTTNVRTGPGTNYDVAWIFVKSDLPVEIIQEFDTWRKIRDLDGSEGWVHRPLLTGRRSAYVAPWDGQAKVALLAWDDEGATVRAWLTSKFLVRVESCNGKFCAVSARNHANEGRATYSGYVEQVSLWGVYPDESFD